MRVIQNMFRKPYNWDTEEGAKFWLKDLEKYGLNSYVRAVLALIIKRAPKKVFELGLGNGFPFAATFLQRGVTVHGCDVSMPLLREVEKNYPTVRWFHGGYEEMVQKTKSELYDVVYSLRTSWYFPNIFLAIDNMIAIAVPGGTVVFDIMNASSPKMKKMVRQIILKRVRQATKNLVKYVLNTFFRRSYAYDKTAFFKDYMVRMRDIDRYLDEKNLRYEKSTFDQLSGNVKEFDVGNFRILYVVEKE